MWTSVLLFVGGAIAAAGGVGGGGLYVPILILAGGFEPHEAVPLSKVIVFGASLASLTRWRHIDLDVAILLEPATLVGAVAGVLLNQLLPPRALLPALVACSASRRRARCSAARACCGRRARRGCRMSPHAKADDDGEAAAAAAADPELSPRAATTATPRRRRRRPTTPPPTAATTRGGRCSGRRRRRCHGAGAAAGKRCSRWRGSSCSRSRCCARGRARRRRCARCSARRACACSRGWWLLLALSAFFPLLLTRAAARQLAAVAAAAPVVDGGGPRWTTRNLVLAPMVSACAGVLAGLLGIGGGLVKGPLLLELGMRPQAAAATSGFMVLFTASSTTLQFLLAGALRAEHVAWLGMVSLAAAAAGSAAAAAALRRQGHAACILFAIGAVVGASALAIAWVEWAGGGIHAADSRPRESVCAPG